MKIATKISLSMILAATVSFSVAGFILLSAFFHSGYEQAVHASLESNWFMLNSFAGYLKSQTAAKTEITGVDIKECVEMVADLFLKEEMGLQVYLGDGRRIFSNIEIPDDKAVRGRAAGAQRVYKTIEKDQQYYIQTVSCMHAGKQTVYFVTFQNITYLYETRTQQLFIYNRVLFVLMTIYSVISFWLAHFIVRPIRSISRTAERIADGNLEYRIRLQNEDEFGEVACNFNRMADHLAGKIEELEDANRRQEEFIGNFTHELKTPLTSIIGYADLMRSDESISELNLMCANYIFQEGKRLESLSFRLLDLIVLKKQQVELKSVSVITLLQQIQATVMPILIKEHVELVMKAKKARIMAEPELIKTVLMNLIDNARKAMTKGGKIEVFGKTEGEWYVITVLDNGKGIPKEQIEKITEAFYMVDKSRSREQGGAGLGLAICAQIVKLHKGMMQFESEEGKGTMVTLHLQQEKNAWKQESQEDMHEKE